PPGRRPARRTAQVVRSDPRDGGWADRPSVDDAGAAELPDSLAALGRSEAPGATAQAITDSPADPHMTTVPCGATWLHDTSLNLDRVATYSNLRPLQPDCAKMTFL